MYLSDTIRCLDGGLLSYALGQRDEDDIEYEEQRRVDVFPYDLPSVIFRTNLVTTFAPVVESQSSLIILAFEFPSRLTQAHTLQAQLIMANESSR